MSQAHPRLLGNPGNLQGDVSRRFTASHNQHSATLEGKRVAVILGVHPFHFSQTISPSRKALKTVIASCHYKVAAVNALTIGKIQAPTATQLMGL
jgi:hypothetical protein